MNEILFEQNLFSRVERALDSLWSERFDESQGVAISRVEMFEPEGLAMPRVGEVLALPAAAWRNVTLPVTVAPIWSTKWLRLHFDAARALALRGGAGLALVFDGGNVEAMAYTRSGAALAAFNGSPGDDRRDFVLLDGGVDEEFASPFLLEVALTSMFGNTLQWPCGPGPPAEARTFPLRALRLLPLRSRAQLPAFFDLQCAAQLARAYARSEATAGGEAARVGGQAPPMRPFAAIEARALVVRLLDRWPDAAGMHAEFEASSLFAGRSPRGGAPGIPHELTVHPIGHCHIDAAWLWSYSETRRKCQRSWATQARFMREDPHYVFGLSQAAELQMVAEDHPALLRELHALAAPARRQLLPLGGSWVEFDGHMPGAEALCRQLLYGQRYFEAKLGRRCDVFFLPDTFGYSPCLPQLVRAAGMRAFVTQKLSWNATNRFPHSTFLWEGLDGTRLLTHFPPAETYVAAVRADELRRSEERSTAAGFPHAVLLFGHGDGGGGPDLAHLERLRRFRRAAALVPRVQAPHADLDALVDAADASDAADAAELPVWRGELYLELHRGTLTSQAHLKRWNRRMEARLRAVELYGVLAAVPAAAAAPVAKLWHPVLLNQFHDVLPGSVIRRAVEEATALYEEVDAKIDAILGSATAATASFVLNPCSFTRTEVFGESLISVPPLSISPLSLAKATVATGKCSSYAEGDHFILKNDEITAYFDPHGRLVELWQGGRNFVLDGGASNIFYLGDDRPVEWEAWDLDPWHERGMRAVSAPHLCARLGDHDAAGLRASLVIEGALQSERCRLRQTVSLSAAPGDRTLRFDTSVQWQEERKVLKLGLPHLDVRAAELRCSASYGHFARPTHRNTSWDAAKFEFCAHKWVDFAEPGGAGVALLNDSKYGHSVGEGGATPFLTLLRSPLNPDPLCDRGTHEFTYTLVPHADSLFDARVIEAAMALNHPLLPVASAATAAAAASPLLEVSPAGVLVEAVKFAEDDPQRLVVRVIEQYGRKVRVRVHFPDGRRLAHRVNLLEEQEQDAQPIDLQEGFFMNPFEVFSFSVRDTHQNIRK